VAARGREDAVLVAEDLGEVAGGETYPGEPAALVPQRELAGDGGQLEQLGEGVPVHLQHRSLGVPEDAVPGLLRVVEVRPGQLDGVSEVIMVRAQECEDRVLLPQQVGGADRALPTEADLPELPHRSPGIDVHPFPDLRVLSGVLELVALRRCEDVDRVAHSLGDTEAGQELEVEPDP
jgi:hypothetical protein